MESHQNDEPFARLSFAIEELTKATTQLEEQLQMKLKNIEVQWALSNALGIESGSDDALEQLVARCPDATEIVRLVQGFNFAKFHPEKVDEVELEMDILPPDVSHLLFEQQIKRNGKIWTIHRNDADPFPSNPHAHNYDKNLKLDLSNGTLYRHKKPQGRVKHKDLLFLRSQVRSDIELPPLAEADSGAM